jgi:hypothetical protein
MPHSMNPTFSPIPTALPLVLRLTGLWLIWSTWASSVGWVLSLTGHLGGAGYLMASPFLLVPCILWWRRGETRGTSNWKIVPWRDKRRWPALCFGLVAALSLAAALVHLPWSFDAITYRLPRCLYWLAENGWYWIGTIDGRLDYSACGLEWQMIPLLLITKSDRFLFLLAYLPFLLLPGLVYLAGRSLGLARRPLRIWMWLLPCAYCIALQCSGLCNDGYSTSYTVASLAFAGVAIRRGDRLACVFSGLAAALLTGAKLSNLPLMLPLGIVFLVAAWKSGFFKRPAVASLLVMALVSFLPLAVLSLKNTGHWTGDPDDQWGFRTGNPIAAVTANLIIAGNDLAKPPVMAATGKVNGLIEGVEESVPGFMTWLKESHRMFGGVRFGDMVYEGEAGPGFAIGIFLLVGTAAGFFLRGSVRQPPAVELWQKGVAAGSLVAWLVLLSQFGSSHSPRNSAAYLPLLLFTASSLPPLRKFLNSRFAPPLALLSMASVIPILILTPARPLVPFPLLDRLTAVPALSGPLSNIVKKYRMWADFRDDLAPMRALLPPGVTDFGYAGAFRDTSYGLWKPLGSRTFREIGTPLKNPSTTRPLPDYIVATAPGIRQRFGMTLEEWAIKSGRSIHATAKRANNLEADSAAAYDEWYLLGPAPTPP